MVSSAQVRPMVRGVRLPQASERAWGALGACAAGPHDLVLVPVPVEPLGRRAAAALSTEAAIALLAAWRASGVPVVALLDHAGPAAALWMRERPVGPSDVAEPRTGRQPRALDASGWAAVSSAYAATASACRRAELPCVLGADNDGLLHAALSPRTAAEPDHARRVARILEMHEVVSSACGAPVDVALVVEELCPGGLDATEGINAATALQARGVRRIYAGAGTAALPALRWRLKGGTARGAVHALHSAAWLRGVGVEVVGLVPEASRLTRLDDQRDCAALGLTLGLTGVLQELMVDGEPAARDGA